LPHRHIATNCQVKLAVSCTKATTDDLPKGLKTCFRPSDQQSKRKQEKDEDEDENEDEDEDLQNSCVSASSFGILIKVATICCTNTNMNIAQVNFGAPKFVCPDRLVCIDGHG